MVKLTTAKLTVVRAAMVRQQKGLCAVCGNPFTKKDIPAVDHCHKTGVIRGVLHISCNQAEGRVRSRASMGHSGVSQDDFLIGLGNYLEKHKTPQTQYIYPTHKTEDEKRLARNKKARVKNARKRASAQLAKAGL